MKLYSYWRSSTSYRVRIALHLKGIRFDQVAVDLAMLHQNASQFANLNPSQAVPVLQLGDGQILTQSMAILRCLDLLFPEPALLPTDALSAARVEAAALSIATDIHPVNNLRVIRHLQAYQKFNQQAWMTHWMREGLVAFQTLLGPGPFCFGPLPTLADICLIPQLYNAHRWQMDFDGLDRLREIEANCLDLVAFQNAHPDVQPDAPKD